MPAHAYVCIEDTTVFKDTGLTEPLGVQLHAGAEMQLEQRDGNAVGVVLSDGATGYIGTEVKVRALQTVFLNQDEYAARAQTSSQSAITHLFKRGDEFVLLETINAPGGDWVKVRCPNVSEAFIEGNVKILTTEKLTESIAQQIGAGTGHAAMVKSLTKQGLTQVAAERLVVEVEQAVERYKQSPEGKQAVIARHQRQMISGILWAVGGTIATAIGYSSAVSQPGGGTYLIFWGAVVFGAFDFLRGLVGYAGADPVEPQDIAHPERGNADESR